MLAVTLHKLPGIVDDRSMRLFGWLLVSIAHVAIPTLVSHPGRRLPMRLSLFRTVICGSRARKRRTRLRPG